MDFLARTLPAVALAACIGEPNVIDCSENPDHSVCAGGSSSGASSSDASSSVGSTGPDEIVKPPVTRLTVRPAGFNSIVGNDLFEIEFDDAQNFMPARLVAPASSPDNLLYDGQRIPERLMGAMLFDQSYSYNRGADPTVFVIDEGPAVVRIDVEWDTPNGPHKIKSANGGPTSYTITPDGRIIRYEQVDNESQEPGYPYWLTAYTALNANRFTNVEVRGPISELIPAEGTATFYPGEEPENIVSDATALLCAHNPDTGVAFGFGNSPHDNAGADAPFPSQELMGGVGWGLRGKLNEDAEERSIGLQFDWARMATPMRTFWRVELLNMVTISPDDPCAEIEAQLGAFVAQPTLDVENGGLLNQFPGCDDDSDGYFENGGYYGVEASGSPMTVRVRDTIPSILLRITGTARIAGVELDGEALVEDTDYFTQETNICGGGHWLWVGREIPINAPLVLTL